MSDPHILIAGIGNVFLGDDGFGVEVVRRMRTRPLARRVRVVDFGIRGIDLAYTLLKPHDLVILVDVVKRGGSPGTLYLMEPAGGNGEAASIEAHGMVPSQVLASVRAMGGSVQSVMVLACEPETFGDPETGREGLSARVEASVEEAIGMIETRVNGHLEGRRAHA